MLYFLSYVVCYIFLVLFCGLKVKGKENIPKKGSFIIASNHTSYFDPPVLAIGCFPRIINFVGKEELFKVKFLRWYFSKAGCIPLKRNYSDFRAIKLCIRKLKEGSVLAIFPEGERSVDGKIGEGQPGVGFLAAKTAVPVVPAYIFGTNKLLPKGAKKIKITKIFLIFGKPLYFDSKKDKDYVKISDTIMQAIKNLADNLS